MLIFWISSYLWAGFVVLRFIVAIDVSEYQMILIHIGVGGVEIQFSTDKKHRLHFLGVGVNLLKHILIGLKGIQRNLLVWFSWED